MIECLFNQTNYLAARRVLDAATLRHEAIAGNLANVETPGYKRLDLAPNFSTELKQAMAADRPDRLLALQPQLAVDPNAIAGTRDGNTVQLESELSALQQNTLSHAVSSQLLTGALLKLRLAITGRTQ